MLPSWVGEQRQMPEARMEFLEDNEPTWKLISHRLSGQPDPLYPYDPEVLRAIQEFWPEAVYLRHLWLYERDGEQYLFMRHAVGSKLRNPKHFIPEQPSDILYDAPVQVELTLCTESEDDAPDLPGEFVEWSWATYYYVRSVYDAQKNAYKQFLEMEKAQIERRERAIEEALEEEEYIRKQDAKLIQRELDKISDVESKEMLNSYEEEQRRAWHDRQCQIRKQRESNPLRLYMGKGEKHG